MALYLALTLVLPLWLWRQSHAHTITRTGLVTLPLILAGIGVLVFTIEDIPRDAAAAAFVASSLMLSVVFGLWRGAVIATWRDDGGMWFSQGNPLSFARWIAVLAAKFVIGIVASVNGWFPISTGEVLLFLGLSFAAQNVVIARRTIGLPHPRRHETTDLSVAR